MVSTAHPICPASTSAPDGGHISEDPWSSTPSLTTLILLSLHAMHTANSVMDDFPTSGSTHDGGLRTVEVVSDNFLIGSSSFSGMFVCHLIPNTPQWLGHQVMVIWSPLAWKAARRIRMSLTSAILKVPVMAAPQSTDGDLVLP